MTKRGIKNAPYNSYPASCTHHQEGWLMT